MEVDRVPLTSLPSRYGIARSLLYTRLKDLNIKPEKDSKQAYVNAEQLARLDALNDHIRQGGTTSEFISKNGGARATLLLSSHPSTEISSFTQLVHEIAAAMRPQTDPLQHLASLSKAELEGWLLTTGEVKRLIGVKPVGLRYPRGSFEFIRSGKIGGQTAWRVLKTESPDTSTALTSPHTGNPPISSPVGN